jgi:UDP-N-acetylglucosamine--N-acetylmuramyl-(pentapeptide) pyrophosphoryl-undecaprenol N-acetylglucosamine transferase
MVDAGAAILMPESQFTSDALAVQINAVLTQERAAIQMANAALSCGKPDATDRLVALVEDLTQTP